MSEKELQIHNYQDNSLASEIILVLVTTPSLESAEKIATTIVEEHLAACVNILPKVQSVFFWENAVQKSDESLMLIKSTKASFLKLQNKILSIHDYCCPEIIAIPLHDGLDKYCAWVKEVVE